MPHARLLCLLAAALLLARPTSGRQVEHVDEAVRIEGLDSVGVTLTSPRGPDFDARVRTRLGASADVALALKPYLVLVTNRSQRRVVSYAVAFDVSGKRRPNETFVVQFKYPDAIALPEGVGIRAQSGELRPSEARVVTLNLDLQPDVDQEWLRNYIAEVRPRAVDNVTIRLDAVIFEDGELAGKDSTSLRKHFLAYVEAKRALYQSIQSRLDAGASVKLVLDELDRRPPPQHARIAENPLEMYAVQALGEVRQMMRSYDAPTLRKTLDATLRAKPFEVWTAEGRASRRR